MTTNIKVHILSFEMMKRLSAILMMMILAGQVLAGVCQCIGEGDGHLCCEKSDELTMKRPPCCTEGDCISSGDVQHSANGQSKIRISIEEPEHQIETHELHISLAESFSDSSTSPPTVWSDPPLEKDKLFLFLGKLII